jgi:hypothetical protein
MLFEDLLYVGYLSSEESGMRDSVYQKGLFCDKKRERE